MSDDLKAELEETARHVAKAKEIVALQLAVVDALRETGHSSLADAQYTLAVLIRTLRLLEEDERLLREEIDGYAELLRGRTRRIDKDQSLAATIKNF